MNLGQYKVNSIYCGECSDMMKSMPEHCIDLTITSPPYDKLRDYEGYQFDFEVIAQQLFRVTKPGGVVVWIVGDATVNGSETGSSFRQALGFMEVGFNLHDTMIYHRKTKPLTHNRYEQEFEYMFVLSKGKPETVNHIKISCRYAGSSVTGKNTRHRNSDGTPDGKWRGLVVLPQKIKGNVWHYDVGGSRSTKDKIDHPATFPEALVYDHIVSWSNLGDLVFDPMIGSGTTAKVAIETNRNFLGFDISQKYVNLAKKRIRRARVPLFV